MRRVATLVAVLLAAAVAAGAAGAADECNGLRVCLPVPGPWVVVPAGSTGVDWELTCPLPRYTVGGTDARVATPDLDVSIRGRTGAPVSPGVTTRRSVVFHATRTSPVRATSSFRPFIGCIPGSGGGGRSLTGLTAGGGGSKPVDVTVGIVVERRVTRVAQVVRASCPAGSRLVDWSSAVGFGQPRPPSAAQRASVTTRGAVVESSVVARITARRPLDGRARVQVRAVCTRAR